MIQISILIYVVYVMSKLMTNAWYEIAYIVIIVLTIYIIKKFKTVNSTQYRNADD